MNFDQSKAEPAAVISFPINEVGRDFIVGDIHGMFPHLELLLDQVSFDPVSDRLFSVGDLVDRGPASLEALKWLSYPWFHACRGNHEQFAIDSMNLEERDFWVRYNGGEWWLDLDTHAQKEYRKAFLRMPLAMEVQTGNGLVGIVHADVPPSLTWERFLDLLRVHHPDVLLYSLFSRNRIHGSRSHEPVPGKADRIYCGHTPVRRPVLVDNVYFIDTAAVYVSEDFTDASLTMVEIQPERHKEYAVATSVRV